MRNQAVLQIVEMEVSKRYKMLTPVALCPKGPIVAIRAVLKLPLHRALARRWSGGGGYSVAADVVAHLVTARQRDKYFCGKLDSMCHTT